MPLTPRRFLEWLVVIACVCVVVLAISAAGSDLFYFRGFPRLNALFGIHSRVLNSIILVSVAVAFATVVVVLFRATKGSLDFSALGIRFQGPSGPILLWTVAFLSISVALRLLAGQLPDSVPTTTERDRIAQFVDATCNRGVLHNPFDWEMRSQVYESVSQLQAEAAKILSTLPADSPARAPLNQIEEISRKMVQNPTVFHQGDAPPEKSLPRPIDGPIRDAIDEFRKECADAIQKLEEGYRLQRHCDFRRFNSGQPTRFLAHPSHRK